MLPLMADFHKLLLLFLQMIIPLRKFSFTGNKEGLCYLARVWRSKFGVGEHNHFWRLLFYLQSFSTCALDSVTYLGLLWGGIIFLTHASGKLHLIEQCLTHRRHTICICWMIVWLCWLTLFVVSATEDSSRLPWALLVWWDASLTSAWKPLLQICKLWYL